MNEQKTVLVTYLDFDEWGNPVDRTKLVPVEDFIEGSFAVDYKDNPFWDWEPEVIKLDRPKATANR